MKTLLVSKLIYSKFITLIYAFFDVAADARRSEAELSPCAHGENKNNFVVLDFHHFFYYSTRFNNIKSAKKRTPYFVPFINPK